MTSNEIRPYGPGKFATVLDSYVYDVTLQGGCDDEVGSSDNGAWFGLMRNGSTIFVDHDPLLESLNEAEQDLLSSSAGVIVREDSDGFVVVQYFTSRQELDRVWSEIVASFAAEEDERAQEDEDDE